MLTFSSLKDLIATLHRERKLLSDMFEKRKSLSYTYEYALAVVDYEADRLQHLIKHSITKFNGNLLEIDDQYLQFFEQVLEVNEEINPSYIHENIQQVKENIVYYLEENNTAKKEGYLKVVMNALRKIGRITLRNVVDVRRNVENTFKNEPNYKVKKKKLEHLDEKRVAITALIEQTDALLSEEQPFFKHAADEELTRTILQLKLQLLEGRHNLIEIEKQVIEYLHQIKYQSGIVYKLRQVKYLKDQIRLKNETNIESLLLHAKEVVFEPNTVYSLKLSLDFLQTDEAYASTLKVASRIHPVSKTKVLVGETIAKEYLENQVEEEIQINLDEVKNSFLASGNHLFDFILHYKFPKQISWEEKVTIYCQMVSQYEAEFTIADQFSQQQHIEFALVYPK